MLRHAEWDAQLELEEIAADMRDIEARLADATCALWRVRREIRELERAA
jgi:hypothetical protein